ncbi:MAG: hypothetical protein NTW16_08610 [Bacteroidetes bacterium]|nr:hypothetical protein [Bacteroidota bacterium]
MKKMIFLVSIMLTTAVLSAQSVWYFGNHGGLVFPGGGNLLPPSPFAGSNMKAAEGCTVVCDNNGNVVFYTDGKHLFDGSNVEITDQFDPARQLLGGPSSTQAALALPIPGSDCKRFLVFTTVGIEDHVNNNALGVCLITVSGSPPYTVVADFPALPVTASNIQFSEKLAATGDETNGFWLLAHDWSGTTDARTFYKYHITETAFLNVFTTADAVKALPGVQYIQVSALWQSQGGSGDNGEYNAQGQMKFDKAGSQLGLVIAGDDVVEIYNFSKASGLLDRTFSFDVPSAGNLYGFEFSPDGTMFYTAEDYTNQVNCNTDPQTYLAQTRDLKQWSPPNTIPYIVATVTTCNPYEFNQLQLGPDNKIYCAGPQSSTTSLSVIDFPDIPGTDCDWHENTIPVANNRMSGLPIVVENSVCNTSIISGYKFNDLNGDGIWLAEPGLAGWVIDLIPVGAPKQSCTTNSNGYYEFADLPAGTYTVTENHQVGWTQTYPYPTKYYQFYLPVNTSTLPINFGNCLGIDPPAGMVAWWPLDELAGPIANDLMGTNNFGTYAGNPAPTNFTGKVAGSLWFNRPVDWPVPDYVEVQDHDDLDFGEGDFSIDAWISPADYPIEFDPDYETIVDKSIDINGKHLGYTLSMYGLNYLALELGDGNNSQTYFSNPFQFLIDGNHWHHVTITVDKTVSHEIKFYIDGVLQGTTPTASGNLDNTNMLRIACASDQVANLFYGRIDEVEMFNRKLEVSEILNISNSGACGKHKPQGKICGFKFNDINGNGIYDSGTEPKVPGWTIQLSGDRGTTTAVTDSYGNYCFDQLCP